MKNEAESLIYTIEKQLKAHDSKLSKEIKDNVRKSITEVNEALKKSGDINAYDAIKSAVEKLKTSALEIGKVLYQSQSTKQEQKPKPEENDPKNKKK